MTTVARVVQEGLVDAYYQNNQATLKKAQKRHKFLKTVQMFLINTIIQNRTNLGLVCHWKTISLGKSDYRLMHLGDWWYFFSESMTRGLTTQPVGPFFKAPFAF